MDKRILLVEDDRYITLALKIRLSAEGFVVDVANDSAEAMQVAHEQAPDIALIDYNLPDGNGFEVMGKFVANGDTAGIDKIIMTASKQPGLRDEAFAAGAIAYFEKPFKANDLIDYIQSLS